jgi:hypothetical protein
MSTPLKKCIRGQSQDAANSSRFLAAKPRLRAGRDGMVAEEKGLEPTHVGKSDQQGHPDGHLCAHQAGQEATE